MYLKCRNLILLLLILTSPLAWSLTLSPSFITTNKLHDIIIFRHKILDIDLSTMPTEIVYSDLDLNGLKQLDGLIEAKKEYGKMFGFSQWSLKDKQIIERGSTRLLILQGTYKNSEGQNVFFMEVYWADKSTSGQVVMTSDTLELKPKNFHEYLVL
jgi:hypothetical protein